MSVQDAGPKLARWLTPGEMGAARRDTVVPVQVVNFGAWGPEQPRACGWRHLGYLVLEGILVRDEELAGSTATELIGAGELLQPWPDTRGVERMRGAESLPRRGGAWRTAAGEGMGWRVEAASGG